MKMIVIALCGGWLAISTQAQLLTPNSFGSAVMGGVIGGIIGHNNGRHTAEGIGIGAGAGLLLGALADHGRREYVTVQRPYTVHRPVVTYYTPRPQRPFSGAVLGGIAGGIIGHNNGRHTGEGIAIGAASGLLLGAVADATAERSFVARYEPTFTTTDSPREVVTTTSPPINPSIYASSASEARATPPSSPMAAANSLFGR